jgi:hypothetical protein
MGCFTSVSSNIFGATTYAVGSLERLTTRSKTLTLAEIEMESSKGVVFEFSFRRNHAKR